MIHVFPARISTTLLTQLASPAARAIALSAVAGLGLTAFRVRNTTARLFTWTAVLYAALLMPLLGWILPPMPIATPVFLQQEWENMRSANVMVRTNAIPVATPDKTSSDRAADRRPNAAHGASRGTVAVNNDKPGQGAQPTSALSSVEPAGTSSRSWAVLPWTVIAFAIYLAGSSILLTRFFVGLAFSRRLLHASQPIDDPRIVTRLAAHARTANLDFTPATDESQSISVPLTMGAMRSTILLPAAWREWDDAQLQAVIAHEVSHVARRDALTQHLSLLHRAIFWFSPLAWFLERHLADLAEQASDEAALSCGANRKDYARILLGFFEALHAAPGRVWWQGVSMAKAGQAEQRVERILSWKGSVSMRLRKSIAVAVIALAVPVVYLAASAQPAHHVGLGRLRTAQDQPPSPPAAPSPEAPPPAVPGVSSGVTGGVGGGIISGVPAVPPAPPAPAAGVAATAIAPMAPMSPMGPMPPLPPMGGQSETTSFSDHGFSYHSGFDDEQRFVIVSGKTDSFTMSGTSEDARHVEKLRKQISGDFIWFQRDEKSYVIRDQATVDRARKLWAPQEELGKKQEELGKQQEALGKQQQELGEKMEKVRVDVPDMTAELDKLRAELKQLSSGATSEQVGHLQSEIGELQSKIGQLQSHAGEQQGKLGEEMGALGEKQGKLGEQQGELGRQQGALAREATAKMKQLLDEAITKGTAQPEL